MIESIYGPNFFDVAIYCLILMFGASFSSFYMKEIDYTDTYTQNHAYKHVYHDSGQMEERGELSCP